MKNAEQRALEFLLHIDPYGEVPLRPQDLAALLREVHADGAAQARSATEHCPGCEDPSLYASKGCPGLRPAEPKQDVVWRQCLMPDASSASKVCDKPLTKWPDLSWRCSDGHYNAPDTVRREALGRLVREVWVVWAADQDNPKPHHLVPWEGLGDGDREVDRRIGETLLGIRDWRTGQRLDNAERRSMLPRPSEPKESVLVAAALELLKWPWHSPEVLDWSEVRIDIGNLRAALPSPVAKPAEETRHPGGDYGNAGTWIDSSTWQCRCRGVHPMHVSQRHCALCLTDRPTSPTKEGA